MAKIVLVTGANKGLGFEIAKRLAEQGCTVFLGARSEEAGRKAAASLSSKDLDVHFIRLDVNNPSDRKNCAEVISRHSEKLDILVNNAGVMLDRDNRASNVSEKILRETFDTNFFSVVALTQELLPLLRKSEGARIVNHSSMLGSLSKNSKGETGDFGLLAYNASKAALNMFTVLLAKELQSTNIKVNSAHPGWVKTDLGSSAAPMEVVDGAKTAVQLATLPDSGPSGGFFHMGEALPW